MVASRTMTAADIQRMGAKGERLELIDDVPTEKPGVSLRHGEIEIRIPIHYMSTSTDRDLGASIPRILSSSCCGTQTRS